MSTHDIIDNREEILVGHLLTSEFLDEEAGGQHTSSAGEGDGDVVVEAEGQGLKDGGDNGADDGDQKRWVFEYNGS